MGRLSDYGKATDLLKAYFYRVFEVSVIFREAEGYSEIAGEANFKSLASTNSATSAFVGRSDISSAFGTEVETG